jgi:DNA-binding CsgD family transcriptional regulator
MPRKRTGTVTESLEKLQQLERHYEGEPQEMRIRVLRLLKEDPSRVLADISAITGCSERSIRRWWATYTQKGIDALLALRGGEEQRKREGSARGEDLLRRKLVRNDFGSLDEVREWLRDHRGTLYSRSEVQFLLNRMPGVEPPWIHCPNPGRAGVVFDSSTIETEGLVIPSRFLRFLNALPQAEDTNEWNGMFRQALLMIFGDIDHIAININQSCNLRDPGSYKPTVVMRQHVTRTAGREREVVVTADAEVGRPSEGVLNDLRSQGRPLDKYHPPHSFDYYYAGHAYLGTLLLFRERGKPQISEGTLSTMDAMEPFLIMAMANHVIWYLKRRPAERMFYDGMERMAAEAGLSVQEQRVVIYYLLGYSYDEMALLLRISATTIKKHINSIHRKTGTRRHRELFARYLSPRLDFPDDTSAT